MEIFQQNEFIINGTGKIIYPHYQVDTTFQIEYNPFHIVLKTPKIILGQLFAIGYGKFEGIISGTDIKIECNNICLSKYTKYRLTFVFLNDLIIGKTINPISFKAKLFGLNTKIDEFKIENYLISARPVENFENLNIFSRKYGYFLETSEIIINEINSKKLDKNKTIQTCKDICLLLSFVLAKNIIYNRCEFIEDNDYQEIIRIKLINDSHGQRFIFEDDLNEIIPIFYENFSKMEPAQKKCLFTSIDYLNSNSNKFLEDSILSIAQVWEISSDTFLKEKIENTENINILRAELKKTIKAWHKGSEVIDYDLGFITGRVLDSLDWQKVIKKLEKLADKESLNSENIGLNFKELISLRNQIAHSGRFKEVGNEIEYLKVYNSALLGIKILILKKLGYTGNITYFTGGIPKMQNISYYLK